MRCRRIFDQRRAALRPKNVAGEYRQLRQDFKTLDSPSYTPERPGTGVAIQHPWAGSSSRCGTHAAEIHRTRRPWRDCTRLLAGQPLDTHPAPTVGCPGGPQQLVAQFTQFVCAGSFVKCGGDVLRRTSHLVDAVRQVSRVLSRQHHSIGGQRQRGPRIAPGHHRPLFVRPLPARLPAVLAAAAHARVSNVAAAPAAWLRAGTTTHA